MKRALPSKHTVVLTIDLSKASRRDFLSGFFEQCNETCNWDVHIVQTTDSIPSSGLRLPPTEDICGLVVVDTTADDSLSRLIRLTDIPAIIVGSRNENFRERTTNTVYLRIDDRQIGKFAAERLLSLGRFNATCFLTDSEGLAWSDLRGLGFQEGMSAMRCPVETCDFTDRKSLRKMLEQRPRPLALFAASDRIAFAALSEIPNALREIPERIALLGVDDDRLICEAARPRLSSIRPDHHREGVLAARELSSLLSARKARKCRNVLCDDMQLVTRETTESLVPAAGLISMAQAYIRENATNGLTPDDVAAHLRISRRLLDLRFQELTDTSVARSIRAAKIEAVKRALEKTRDNFCDIAHRCGFKNANHLKNAFKDETGCSMREWRNAHAAR